MWYCLSECACHCWWQLIHLDNDEDARLQYIANDVMVHEHKVGIKKTVNSVSGYNRQWEIEYDLQTLLTQAENNNKVHSYNKR